MKPVKAISIIIFLEFLIIVFSIVLDGFTLEALQTTTRFSGRLSLILFSVIFLFSYDNEKLTSYLSAKFFLVFAIAHGIHLIELLSYIYLSGNQLNPVRVLGGFLAYLIIFIMPVLQHVHVSGKVKEKNFLRFRTFYLYYIWFIFFMTYLPRVMGNLPNIGGNYWEFAILFVWVLIVLTIKLSRFIKFSPAPKP